MLHLRFEPCQVLLDLEVEEVFRRRSFLEEVEEVFRRRSFLEEVEEEVVVEVEPFPPQVVEVEPFPPQVVEVVVEVGVLLRLLDRLEEVSVRSFFAPIYIVGCREIIF